MAFINPTPGVAHQEVLLEIDTIGAGAGVITSSGGIVSNVALGTNSITVPAMSKLTVNTSNGTYEWAQLDSRSKHVVATVSTNSVVTNIVVDPVTFFGNASATSGSAAQKGVFGLQTDKTRIAFKLRVDGNVSTGAGDTISGQGYLTQLAPTIDALQPVWQTPVTIVVDGDFLYLPADAMIGE